MTDASAQRSATPQTIREGEVSLDAGEPGEPSSPEADERAGRSGEETGSVESVPAEEPGRDLVVAGESAPATIEHAEPASESGLPQTPPLWRRLFGAIWPSAAPDLRANLREALEVAGEDGFSPEERALLRNILALREERVEDVMIPRGDIVALEATTTLADALECFEESGHSRLPVYGETLDDPRGMVHIRDVMDLMVASARGRRRKRAHEKSGSKAANAKNGSAKGANGNGSAAAEALPARYGRLDMSKIGLDRTLEEAKLIRDVLFVPPSMPAMDLMALMQARRIQIALVIDEYGGTDGLASLEDVVEVIVGDIEDEHDDAEEMIVQRSPGTFEVDGRAELEDVAEALGFSLVGEEERDEEIDTLGGLIFMRLGRVPLRGEVVQIVPGHEFQVLEADARRIRRVRISPSRGRARPRRRA